jgi:hypothetical protein
LSSRIDPTAGLLDVQRGWTKDDVLRHLGRAPWFNRGATWVYYVDRTYGFEITFDATERVREVVDFWV